MSEGRELTAAEKKAVDRVEKALNAIPDTLALHFNESGFHVFDKEVFNDISMSRGGNTFEEMSSDHRCIGCRYDGGAL